MEDRALQTAIDYIDAWLMFRSHQVDIPGFSVAVYYQDSFVLSRAFGFANLERSELLTTDHIFSVASQSKMFTATALLQLVAAGKLQLDDVACNYIPWLAAHHDHKFREISIRQLLAHSAGLVRDGLDSDFWELKRPFPSADRLKADILQTDIATEPNRTVKYSNLGYALLGQVIEAVSGQSYQAYLRKHIMRKLKLSSTFPDFSDRIASQTATGYGAWREHGRTVLEPRRPTKAMAPAVGVHATTEDMCRFAASQFFGDDRVISDHFKREAQRTQAIVSNGRGTGAEFGLGARIRTQQPHRLIGHDGHLLGHVSVTFFDPDRHLAVAVAANAQDAPCFQIANGILSTLDWFTRHLSVPAPPALARFNARLRSDTSAIDVVATADHLAAIDPASWSPVARVDTLMPINDHTLRITTPGNFDQLGELIFYKFSRDIVRAVRYAGLTMVPESGYIGRPLGILDNLDDALRLTFDDLDHANLRIGRVLKVMTLKDRRCYRLLVDFGPILKLHFCYLPFLPQRISARALIGKQVLGAVFDEWSFGKVRHSVLALGLALEQQANMQSSAHQLVTLIPDPTYPRTVGVQTAVRALQQLNQALDRSFFKFEARPEYLPEDVTCGDSLTAWQAGKHYHALALLRELHDPNYLAIPRRLHIMIVDDQLSAYQRWSIEFKKRVSVPTGSQVYLLPRRYIRSLSLPAGDFSIWDEKRITVNSYTDLRWTHLSLYDADKGNSTAKFLKLERKLIRLAARHGSRLVT